MDMDRYSIYIYKSGEIIKIFEITPVACVYHGTLATLPMTEETAIKSADNILEYHRSSFLEDTPDAILLVHIDENGRILRVKDYKYFIDEINRSKKDNFNTISFNTITDICVSVLSLNNYEIKFLFTPTLVITSSTRVSAVIDNMDEIKKILVDNIKPYIVGKNSDIIYQGMSIDLSYGYKLGLDGYKLKIIPGPKEINRDLVLDHDIICIAIKCDTYPHPNIYEHFENSKI